jgi:hypothetical protein
MNTFSDTQLTEKVKEFGDEVALIELISRHSGIYVNMVRKFGSKSLSYTQMGQILDEKDYNIYEAALDYDESRAKFSTHIANKAKYICLTEKTKNKKNSSINYDYVDFFIETPDNTPEETCIYEETLNRILNMISDHEDERVRLIFNERYFGGESNKLKPWNKVAEKTNLSHQGCINIHNRTIENFRKKVSNERIKL